MDLVNNHREKLGLQTLEYSPGMSAIIEKHAKNMALGKVAFGHSGSATRCNRAEKVLGGGNLCGEIVAWGQKDAKKAFQAWLNSKGHRAIIENGRYNQTGFGFYKNKAGRIYWAQIFVEL